MKEVERHGLYFLYLYLYGLSSHWEAQSVSVIKTSIFNKKKACVYISWY